MGRSHYTPRRAFTRVWSRVMSILHVLFPSPPHRAPCLPPPLRLPSAAAEFADWTRYTRLNVLFRGLRVRMGGEAAT